jgi:hydrogenase maturation protein HypF
MIEALKIHVTGIVQGVGFRPFIYRLAKRFLINGWVLNAADGVTIHAEGEGQLLDEFVLEISDNAPAASRVEEIELEEVPLEGFQAFEIRFSDEAEVEKTTLVSPDLATCDDCIAELFDPSDKRFHYPFINCTNCGPRFTIIRALPYDRAKTSMGAFSLCSDCDREYHDPLNRRFHAQPDACFACGPHISYVVLTNDVTFDTAASLTSPGDQGAATLPKEPEGFNPPIADPKADPRVRWGNTVGESDAIIADAAELLHRGGIVAVKGLGGFHLACDAANEQALATLRLRKRREGKAFAVMVRTVEDARAHCLVSAEEESTLKSPARPIVLLKKRPDVPLARGLADDLPELGVMLPATPLQHLLIAQFGSMLVMTSGNVHDEPIETDDVSAYRTLGRVADAFVGNDRPILSRYDDSVVRVIAAGSTGETVQVIRRARGYAPLPLAFDEMSADRVLFATGPEQKNTLCYARNGEAFVSQHIGDMESAPVNDAWLQAKDTYGRVLQMRPTHVACDKHPEYLTSKWAAGQALPVVAVQHHHAHVVSAMAENGLEGPVCGIAFDGTGYGEDGAIWGGEVLISNLGAFERFGNFAYVPLPGGAAAIRHPLRCAYGALWAFDLLDHPAARPMLDALGDVADICEQMIDRGLNSPYTSSVGRLFDAASAILGICAQPAYEGEGAILLEAAITNRGARGELDASGEYRISDAEYRIDVVKNVATETSTALDTSVVLMDAAPLFQALLDDVGAGVAVSMIARRFHDAFVDAIVAQAQLVDAVYGIRTVVLSGGVFMNRYLTEHALAALEQAGFTVAINRDLPPNDGCISYGQAVVARHLV